MTPLGFVDLDGVWVDDRRRCQWALRGVDLTLEPGQLAAILGDADAGGPAALFDLLTGRRQAIRGHVSIDGIDLAYPGLPAECEVVELGLLDGGERRLCIGPTQLVLRPSPATVAAADVVVSLDDGLVGPAGAGRELAAS